MTETMNYQAEGLTRALKDLDLLENKSRKAEREAARLTRAFTQLDLGFKSGSGSGAQLFDLLGSGLAEVKSEMTDLAATGRAAAGAIGSAFGSAFKDLMLEGKGFKSVLASLEADLLRLGSRTFSGGSDSGAGMLASLAGSLFPGFASGGSFTVGGAAGVDSNLVGLRLTRGEKVTVETPAQARQSDSGGVAPVSVNFNITTPDADSFRRSQSQIQGEALRQARRLLQRNG